MSTELPVSGDPGEDGKIGDGPMALPLTDGFKGSPGRLGNYEVIEELGRGGMGVVYRARQLFPERMVALKTVLAGHLGSIEALNRFRIEAEAAAALTHPNIVPIYEFGEAGGMPYISMPLVEGVNLSQWNKRSEARDAAWLRQTATLTAKIARAVHFAHQHGILHRDIKPSNILLDSRGEPHLTDFGLAKLVTRTSELTVSGTVVGTPDYMSPEQAEGGTKNVTTAADVFTLGAVFYELLTGRLPFHAETDLETRRRVMEAEVAKPRAVNRAVDRDLETICLTCLEKEPWRRYPSAEALADDLDRWQGHQPIQARPVSLTMRAAKWTRRHWALSAVAGMGLVFAIAYALTMARDKEQLQIALADSLLHEGQALAANRYPAEAKERLQRSRSLSQQTKTTSLPAELSLADVYRFSPPALATLRGHRGTVTCLAIRSDQRGIVSGGEDGTIRTWSWPLGRQEEVREGHTGGVLCLALSPDGRFCVSGGMDKKIRIWDAQTSAIARTIEAHQQPVTALAIAPDGDVLASAGWDRNIRIWRLRSGEEMRTIQTRFDKMPRLAFSADGRQVVAATHERGFGVWNLDDPDKPVAFLPYKLKMTVACAQTGNWILHGDNAGDVGVATMNDGGYLRLAHLPSAITAVAFLPPGQRAVAGTVDGLVAVIDMAPREPAVDLMLSGHETAVTAVAAFADGRSVASSSRDGTIRIWDSRPPELRQEILRAIRGIEPSPMVNPFTRVVFSPGNLLFLSAGQGGELKLWDAATGAPLLGYQGHDGVVLDANFSPDARFIVSCGQDATVRIWDVAAGSELRRFHLERKTICRVCFSADGRAVVGGESCADYPAAAPDPSAWFRLRAWETETGRELCQAPAHRGGVLALAISPSGHAVLTGGGDGRIGLWDTTSWHERSSFVAGNGPLEDVAFTRNSAECVSLSAQHILDFWDLLTGKEMRRFPIKEELLSLAVRKGGSWLLAGMNSGSMRLWDLTNDRELHAFSSEPRQGLSAIAIAPNGSVAISAGGANNMHMWRLDCGGEWPRLEATAFKSCAALRNNPHDGAALRALGEWYQLRGFWDWAGELFEQARTEGAKVEDLALARCYWQGGRLERAQAELEKAARLSETPSLYVRVCLRAIERQLESAQALKRSPAGIPQPGSGDLLCQPGPADGKDIWTTSELSFGPGGDTPGGGMANNQLRVGGWGDYYLSLLCFDLTAMPSNASSATLYLYCSTADGGGASMYIDRIAEHWDWRTSGTGRDHDRLWWADRPRVSPWRTNALPPATAERWYAIDLTDLYNAWQSGAFPNHGVQLRPEKSANKHFNIFYGSRYTNNPALRPKLIISPRKRP